MKILIYILIAIGYGLYQWYKAAKKKEELQRRFWEQMKTEQTAAVPSAAATSYQPSYPPVTPAVVDYETEPIETKNYDTYTTYETLKAEEQRMVELNNQSLETLNYDFTIPQHNTEQVYQQTTPAAHWLVGNGLDDIKKAIIWSEILKRPRWAEN